MTDPKRPSANERALELHDSECNHGITYSGGWECLTRTTDVIVAAEVAAYKLGRENAMQLSNPAAERAAEEARDREWVEMLGFCVAGDVGNTPVFIRRELDTMSDEERAENLAAYAFVYIGVGAGRMR